MQHRYRRQPSASGPSPSVYSPAAETSGPSPSVFSPAAETSGPNPPVFLLAAETSGPNPPVSYSRPKPSGPSPSAFLLAAETSDPSLSAFLLAAETPGPSPPAFRLRTNPLILGIGFAIGIGHRSRCSIPAIGSSIAGPDRLARGPRARTLVEVIAMMQTATDRHQLARRGWASRASIQLITRSAV